MNTYAIYILIAFLLVAFSRYTLEYLKISYLKRHGKVIPPEFVGNIDEEVLKRVNNYTIETTNLGVIASIFNDILIILFFFGGILNIYNTWIASFHLDFIVSGILFFLLLVYADMFLTIPFNLYQTFKIEKKYGFNTMTVKLWFVDFLKSILITTLLLSLVIAVGLWIVQKSPLYWWLWVWFFFLIFGILIMYISPYVIEPLFNKFSPVDDPWLRNSIQELTQKAGLKINKILKMDASKRTKHTNAYFTGIGKVKRVVLYDTLLNSLNREEILAVLGHELGHWKKKHVLKQLILIESVSLVVLYLAFKLLQSSILLIPFGITVDTLFARIVVLLFLGTIISFPFTPLFNLFSRKHEKEADTLACKLTGNSSGLISALVKLSKDNLANLYPHPLYSIFYYSHPPVVERLRYISHNNAFVK